VKKTEEKKEHGFQVMANIGLREELLLGSALRKKKQKRPLRNLSVSLFSLRYRLRLRLGVVLWKSSYVSGVV